MPNGAAMQSPSAGGGGQLSRKTQRVYATASQGQSAHGLKTLRIEVERQVKAAAPDVAPADPDEPWQVIRKLIRKG
jgi:hypothetical protein